MPNYVLSLEPAPSALQPNKLYLTLAADKLHFAALSSSHERIEGEITSEQLGITPDDLARLNTIEALQPYSARIHNMAGLLDEPLVEVPIVIEGTFHGEHVEIGVRVNQFEDPTDPNFVLVSPTLYVKNQAPNQPRHIVMLVDVSGSMHGQGINAIHETLPLVFAGLQKDDRVSLISFSEAITPLITNQPKSELLTEFNDKVASLRPEGGTALNDAILSLAEKPGIIPSHTTVLILTDGQDGSPIFRAPPRELIAEFNRRFLDNPPRLFPIGLGDSYDHEFMKQCSIAANFGMIDARDQSRLPEHVAHIIDGLAMGIHVGLTTGDGEPTSLGIVGYNTVNINTPQRVRKTALESHGIGICIENNTYTIPSGMILPASPESVALGLQAFLKENARKCYDNFALSNNAKMDEIERLMSTYAVHMEEQTRIELTTLLHVLDKKSMTADAKAIISIPDPRYKSMSLYRPGWEGALDTAIRAGALRPRYAANESYIAEIIANFQRGNNTTASINRVPASSIQAIDTTTANRFTSTSTLSSDSFTATMSRPPFYRNYHAPTNVITLDRRVDFSKLPQDATIESSFAGRETIRLLTSSALFQAVLAEATPIINPSTTLEANLANIIRFVQDKLNSTDLTRIGLMPMSIDLGSKAKVVDMNECLREHAGVCRHQSLLTAALVGKLVETGLLPAGNVTHYRAATNQLKSHSFAIYIDTHSGSAPVYYLLDPAANLYEKIASPEDFERCVKRYNDLGLDWILRNFAKDNGFVYPHDEDLKPIGIGAIRLLEMKALLGLSSSDQMHFVNELIREGLMPKHQCRIQETPENKTRLWNTLVKYGCIFPEETTLEEQSALTDSLSEKVATLETDYLRRTSAPVAEPSVSSVTRVYSAASAQTVPTITTVTMFAPPKAIAPPESLPAPKTALMAAAVSPTQQHLSQGTSTPVAKLSSSRVTRGGVAGVQAVAESSPSRVTKGSVASAQADPDQAIVVAIAPRRAVAPPHSLMVPKTTSIVATSQTQQPLPQGRTSVWTPPSRRSPAQTIPPAERVPTPEQKLKDGLLAYKAKIEKTYGGRFDHAFAHFNFSFFRTWQAENRQANYLLTLNLLKRLNSGEPLEDVFPSRKALLSLRKTLMSGKAFHDHGINSDDLNQVLDAASQLIETRRQQSIAADLASRHVAAMQR